MDNDRFFTIIDDGVEKEVTILNIINIGSQEYAMYSVRDDVDKNRILAAKLVDNDRFVSIDDDKENFMVYHTIKEMMNSLD